MDLQVQRVLRRRHTHRHLAPIHQLLLPRAYSAPTRVAFNCGLIFYYGGTTRTASFTNATLRVVGLQRFVREGLLRRIVRVVGTVGYRAINGANTFGFTTVNSPNRTMKKADTRVRLVHTTRVLRRRTMGLQRTRTTNGLYVVRVC